MNKTSTICEHCGPVGIAYAKDGTHFCEACFIAEGWPLPNRKRRRMPPQQPATSEQVVCTPKEFLDALRHRLGIRDFSYDLAASHENAVCPQYFTEEDDALIQDWGAKSEDWNFCNPPYTNIEPWVSKAWRETQYHLARTAMLLPASVGSNWWRDYVDGKAYATFLNGRITFVGHSDAYPKDLVVLLYAPYLKGGSCVWDWE